ncbi:MAG: hypothetical protein IKC39_01135 [Clostridia bacterium]|nr:hypothetical protein [Clostridia bacterium]
METKTKMNAREWMENLWYHYKWLIIFGGLILAFLIISLFQHFGSKDPDVNILHVGPMYISPESAETLKGSVATLSEDYNDDGDINVALLDITVNKFGNEEEGIDPMNYDQNNNGLKRFQTEVRAGDAVIYLLDEEFFNICMEENLLSPLKDVVSEEILPENTVKGYGVKISDLDAYKLSGLSNVPNTAILCLRRSPELDPIKYGRTVEVWEGNRKTFENILKYKAK